MLALLKLLRTRAAVEDPPPDPGEFVASHPRVNLTTAVLADLAAKKAANAGAGTAEYQLIAAVAAAYPITPKEVALSGALGTGGAGTTFTVTGDLTGWPTASHQIRIDVESLIVTRSGSTFTVVTRGNDIEDYVGFAGYFFTTNAAHASGAEVWYHQMSGVSDYVASTTAVAMMVRMGDSSYVQKMRYLVGDSAMVNHASRTNGDNAHTDGYWGVQSLDWAMPELSTNEKTVFGASTIDHLQYLEDHQYGWATSNELMEKDATAANNHFLSEMATILAGAAAIYDEYPTEAQAFWDEQIVRFDAFVVNALTVGAISDGFFVEGTAYGQEDSEWMTLVLRVMDSALGVTTTVTTYEPWFEAMVRAHIYLTWNQNPNLTTAITGTSGMSTATVSDSTGWTEGTTFRGGGVPANAVIGISGNTWTLREPLTTSPSGATITPMATILTIGDTGDYYNYMDKQWDQGRDANCVEWALQAIRGTNPTLANYGRWWLNNRALREAAPRYYWMRLVAAETSTTAVDYTSVLPKNYVTTLAPSSDSPPFGLLIGRSSWSDTAASIAYFIGGHFPKDHSTMWYGSDGFMRNGVWLSRQLQGYGGPSGTAPFFDYPTTGNYYESPYVGVTGHNGVWMNGHGSYSPQTYSVDDGRGAVHLTHAAATSSYLYGRLDASKAYDSTAARWVDIGYASADALTFVRRWIYINPDLTVRFDRLTYANASTSPTKWFQQTQGEPTWTGTTVKTASAPYAGEAFQIDILLPASATVTKTEWASENANMTGWRSEIVSGVSATEEYGLRVQQGGTPDTVTLLTSGNCYAVQVGTRVFVFPTGASPTLNLTWTKVGTVTETIVDGLTASTDYHATYATDDGTVATATGSGDTTSTAAGLVIF